MTAAVSAAELDVAAGELFRFAQGLVPEQVPECLRSYGGESVDPGLPLQVAVIRRWEAAGERVGGYKIAWTSRGGRDRGGPGFRPFGYILASRIFASGARLARRDIHVPVLEAEICLTMGEDLDGEGVTVEQARAAVASVSPAFEICSRRGQHLSLAARVGNAMNNWGLVAGAGADPGIPIGGLDVRLIRDGEVLSAGMSDPQTVDDPFVSLTRVCRSLAVMGRGVKAGDRLLTGSILPGADVGDAREMTATFGELGSVTVYFD